MKTRERRQLRFEEVGEVVGDVARLVEGGHRMVGRWTLAQVCSHLTFTIEGSLEGFPIRTFPWVVRATFGKLAISNMVRTERIPEGFWFPKKYTASAESDLGVERDRLRDVVERYLSHTGLLAPHPFIGVMPRELYDRYHCVHCAHHLSFAVPIMR